MSLEFQVSLRSTSSSRADTGRLSRGGPARRGRGRGRRQHSQPLLPSVSELARTVHETKCVAWLALRRYALSASWLGPSFSDAPIWQATLLHTGDSSLTTRALDALRAFLAGRHATIPESPADLQALRASSAITVAVGAARDEEGLGVSNAALGFYVEGDIGAFRNLLALIHEYIVFRLRQTSDFAVTTEPPLLLEVFVPSAVDVRDTVERFGAVETTCDTSDSLPVDVFAAPPPAICNGLLLQIEWHGSYEWFHGTLSGYTWPFRRELQREGILGARDPTGEGYYRVWPRCDLDVFGGCTRFDDIRRDCLYGAPIRLLLTESAPAHTRAHLFVVRVAADSSISMRLAHTDHEPFDAARLERAVARRREAVREMRASGAAAAPSAAGGPRATHVPRAGEAPSGAGAVEERPVLRDTQSARSSCADAARSAADPHQSTGERDASASRDTVAVLDVDVHRADERAPAGAEERAAHEMCSGRVRSPSPSRRAAQALAESAMPPPALRAGGSSDNTAAVPETTEAEEREASPCHEDRHWKLRRRMLSTDVIGSASDEEDEPPPSQRG